MGEYFGTGGGIGTGYGRSLAQVQLWDFNSRDDEKSYSFQSPHGTVRYWLLHLLQIDSDDGKWLKGGLTTYYENMAVASRYGWDDIIERRFKPMYHYYLNDIAGPPEFDQMNFTNHSFVTYFKSALIFFYISEIIKDRSEGTKNLDEAVKLLYKDALEGKCVSRNSLIEALNRLTDYDFASVVDNYLCGHEKLDLDYWLK